MSDTSQESMPSLVHRAAWMDDGLCQEPRYSSVSFFPAPSEPGDDAKAVCGRCLVREECGEYAIAERLTEGVWGGMTAAERQAVTKERRRREQERAAHERAVDAALGRL